MSKQSFEIDPLLIVRDPLGLGDPIGRRSVPVPSDPPVTLQARVVRLADVREPAAMEFREVIQVEAVVNGRVVATLVVDR